jgi:predicted PurR-regulated permease PerM
MNDSQKWLALAFVAGLGVLLYFLAPMLMPFVMAAILAYLGDPLVDKLETLHYRSWRLNRTFAVLVVFLGIILIATGILLVVIPTIEYQISEFIEKLPSYLHWFNKSVVPKLQTYFGKGIRPLKTEQLIGMIQAYWQDGATVSDNLLQSVSHSGAVILGWVMNLVLIPVISFYLLRDWDDLVVKVHNLFPRTVAKTVGKLATEVDMVLGAFLRGQFYVMLAVGLIYSAGLLIIDLDLALLIGMHLVSVLLVFGIGHSIEGMLLTPWLVGNKIGLHPVAVIFAVLAGGQLFGFLGILLALPVASVIMVLLRHIHERYTVSQFYGGGHYL